MCKIIIILLFTLHLAMSDGIYEEGSPCPTNDKETGECTYIEDCEYAKSRLRNRKRITTCFYRGLKRYVCCVEAVKNNTVVQKPTAQLNYTQAVKLYNKGLLKYGDIECRFNGTFPVKCCRTVHDFTALRFGDESQCEDLKKPYARKHLTPHQSVIYDACYTYSKLGSKCVEENGYYKRDSCERFKGTVKISDGDPAMVSEFPHMAVTGARNDDAVNISWIGGGSLISEYYILTAAHAIGSTSVGVVRYALLGTIFKNDTRSGELYYVVNRIMHPEYNKVTKENDIALFKLHARVKFSDFIRPACLPFPGSHESDYPSNIIAGWGSIAQKNATSDVLLKAFLFQEYDHDICKDKMEHQRVKWNKKSMICAKSGPKRTRQDSCQGDSGGPLMATSTEFVPCSYFVAGVVSWGGECGVGGYGSYTNVSYEKYQEWIVETVWPLEFAARNITLY